MKYLTVFSDASFHQTGAAGYAYYVRDADTIVKDSHKLPWRSRTSTEVELFAMCHAIIVAIDSLDHQSGDEVVAQTDCTHVIEGFDPSRNFLLEFERNMRDSTLRALGNAGLSLRFKHVKAHTGNEDKRSHVNRFCDTMARSKQRHARRVGSRREDA